MRDIGPNLSFERDGKALREWLVELVSADAAVRQAAGDAVAAMFYGVPSVHTDLNDIGGDFPNRGVQQAAWRSGVREACEHGDFPRRAFFLGAAAQLIGAHDQYMREIMAGDEQFNRICARIGARLELAETARARTENLRRLGRALCASIARECEQEPKVFEAMSFTQMTLSWAVAAAGPAILEAPEAIWMMIESRSQDHTAYEALQNIGPAAAPLFLDHLLEEFERAEVKGNFNESGALAAVGQGNRAVIERVLEALAQWNNGIWSAANVVHMMGESARMHEQALPVLLRLTESADATRRAAAAYALGGVARGIDDAVDALLRLTHDQYCDEESGGQIVVAHAMTALGEIGRQGDRVVPRLVELFDTFEEYDCDMGYGGPHQRQVEALLPFRGEAVAAVPTIVRCLERSLEEDFASWNEDALLHVLRRLGPAASEALPVLEKLEAARVEYELREESEWIDEEDDEDEVDEVSLEREERGSEFQRTIRLIRGS